MNALELYAHVKKYGGTMEDDEEAIMRLSKKYDEELQYFAQYIQDDKFYYEYLILTPRQGREYLDYYRQLESGLEELSVEQQYKTLKQMETIKIDDSLSIDFFEARGSYTNRAASRKYPLFSLRGTCNREKNCSCDCPCGRLRDIPCCSGKKVGCSNICGKKYLYYSEILTDLVLWMVSCPNVDALYVMHDIPPVFSLDARLYFKFAFLLKDSKITYTEDEKEVERLYLEYNKKYPCDTSDVEDRMNRLIGRVSKFHF